MVAVRVDRLEYGRESLVDFWSQSESTGRNIVGKASWIFDSSLSRQVEIWSGKSREFLVAVRADRSEYGRESLVDSWSLRVT